MSVAEYATVTEARAGMKDMLDAAEIGGAGLIHRENTRFTLMNADILSSVLRSSLASTPEVYFEDDRIGLTIPGAPFAVEGHDLEDAAEEMIVALRDYASDWERLRHAPNHKRHQALVLFILASTDATLKAWLTGDAEQ